MSYPPPPGLKQNQTPSSSSSTPSAHASLPPRPPPAAGPPPSFKPAFGNTPSFSSGAPGTRGYEGSSNKPAGQPPSGFGGFTGFQPRSVAANTQPFRTHSPVVSAPPAPPTGFSGPQTNFANGVSYQAQPSYPQPPTPSYYPQTQDQPYVEPTPPQIRNPFPLPDQESRRRGAGRSQEIDPEMEAQIAQWQSAYASKDDGASRTAGRTFSRNTAEGNLSATGANSGPLGVRQSDGTATPLTNSAISSAANADTGVAAVVTGADGKQKTVIRSGGGQQWQDPSLLEWDPSHFRLFVGNLAGEVTDESLLKAFAKFASVQKARVVRDKRTTKSKGYGFVSFADGEEYFQAARDMQGKYIGSHPVLLRKSTTEIKATVPQDKKKGKGGKGGGSGLKGTIGGGVQKKSNKTKGGLRVLG